MAKNFSDWLRFLRRQKEEIQSAWRKGWEAGKPQAKPAPPEPQPDLGNHFEVVAALKKKYGVPEEPPPAQPEPVTFCTRGPFGVTYIARDRITGKVIAEQTAQERKEERRR